MLNVTNCRTQPSYSCACKKLVFDGPTSLGVGMGCIMMSDPDEYMNMDGKIIQ